MSKIALITGANRGIGFALSQVYAKQGYEVIAVCRSSSEELEALADQVISGIDVTDDNAIATLHSILAATLGDRKIDVVMNNAGLFLNETLDDLNFESISTQFEVNAIAPLKVIHAVQEYLTAGSKIGNITSRMGSIEDNSSGAYYGYRASKAALNAISKSLAIDLKTKGISVAVLHPGFVQTRMVGFNGDISPDQAAQGLYDRMEALSIETTGGFWHSNGQALPW